MWGLAPRALASIRVDIQGILESVPRTEPFFFELNPAYSQMFHFFVQSGPRRSDRHRTLSKKVFLDELESKAEASWRASNGAMGTPSYFLKKPSFHEDIARFLLPSFVVLQVTVVAHDEPFGHAYWLRATRTRGAHSSAPLQRGAMSSLMPCCGDRVRGSINLPECIYPRA